MEVVPQKKILEKFFDSRGGGSYIILCIVGVLEKILGNFLYLYLNLLYYDIEY